MKNTFKLLPLAFLGSLFVGESYGDENFTSPVGTYSVGHPFPSFVDIDEALQDWVRRHELLYINCLANVEERGLEEYGCVEHIFHSLRPTDNARSINGNLEGYLISRIAINHVVYRDSETNRLVSEDIMISGGGNAFTLTASCPSGSTARVFNVTSDSLERYCLISDTSSDNSFSVGNPINYISRQKNDLVDDFQGDGALTLSRYYMNQNEGWTLNDTSKLVDLYHVELGEPIEVDFKTAVMDRRVSIENTEDNILENGITRLSMPVSYVVPDEANRKVLIADQYGITQSFFGGPTVFRSSVDSSLLTYVPENNQVPASWRLVDIDGVQQLFNNSGDVTEIRYPNGDIIFYQYDEHNRVVKKENKLGDYIAYEYDTSGNAVKATVMPENIVFDYIYETIETGTYPDRLIEVKQDQVTTLKYQYDDLAFPLAMTSVTDGNDITLAHWDYNADGDAILTSPDNVDAFSLNYNRRVDGPVTIGGDDRFLGTGPEITNPFGSTTSHAIRRIAGYDRVVATVDRPVDGSAVETQFFTYDSTGNLNSETDVNGDVTYKVYDTNRFLIEETVGYRWNNEVARYGLNNNPFRFLVADDIKSTHHCWNTETGLRTRTITDDIVTTFVYSELGQIINTIEEPANSTNNTCD